MSPKYTLNRKGWLAAELASRYPGVEGVERIAAGFCFDQFEQDARDRANLKDLPEPQFPSLSADLTQGLRG